MTAAPKPFTLAKRWAKADPDLELLEESDPLLVAWDGVEVTVREDEEGLILEHVVEAPPATLAVLGDDAESREAGLANLAAQVAAARAGMLTAQVEGSTLRLATPVRVDGLTHHAFATAVAEVAKARQAFEVALTQRAVEDPGDVHALWKEMEEAAVDESPPTQETWRPTHVVPEGGLPAYADADPGAAKAADLAPGVRLALLREWGAWAEVLADNGWRGWVDGRRLVRLG